jgi:hypothetical protein
LAINTATYSVIESYIGKTSITEFWNNGIVFIKLKDNIQIELEDSKSQYNLLKSKFDGFNKYLALIETGIDTSISKEAREFGERPESNEMTTAMAVIVKSLAHRIIINFIIKFTHHQTMKMFEDKQKAINWLLSFKTK